jgi:cytochrome P450 family 135
VGGRWAVGTPFRVRPRMQALTLEIILRAVFGLDDGPGLVELRVQLRHLLDRLTNPRRTAFLIALGPERIQRFGPFVREMERVDRLIYAVIAARRAQEATAERDDILSMLAVETAAGEDCYLKAVVYETLHLRPVISLINRTLKPARCRGHPGAR